MTEHISPLAVPISDAVKMAAIGRTTFYKLMKAGDIPARKCGARTVVLMVDLERFLLSLPEANGGRT